MTRIKETYSRIAAKMPGGGRGLVAGAAIAAALLGWWMISRGDGEGVRYETTTLERGSVRSVVSATGTLGALVTVEVGSQLSGQISELHADFNSIVHQGQLIARLDPATFETRVKQSEAELAIARAGVEQAVASVAELTAALAVAELSLDRQERLRARDASSEQQLDAATAEFEKAKARLTSAKAQIVNAEAQVKQREASLEGARVDLERTHIRSPVDGVVVGRDVDIGQTVAASLQAPVLFTIAQDLSKMQLEVNVDEADIGQIREDQNVDFSVDAYPRRKFGGVVKQIRKAPIVEQNVVTYTVIVSADNDDQSLLPGMTANVEILIAERDDVFLVPNRALRFRPAASRASDAARGRPTTSASFADAMAGGAPGPSAVTAMQVAALSNTLGLTGERREKLKEISAAWTAKSGSERSRRPGPGVPFDMLLVHADSIKEILDDLQKRRFERIVDAHESDDITRARIWVLKDGETKMVPVSLGISDGNSSELVLGDIGPETQILIGSSDDTARSSAGRPGPRFF